MPKIKDFTFKVVDTPQQLDELANDGFDLSSLDIHEAHYRLQKKAIVNLLFIGNELAYRGWWAMTEEAKNTFNRYPYKVDFSNGEVCIGDAWANPQYRKQGISTYVDCKLDEILMDRGIREKKLITLTSNIAAQRTLRRIGGYNLYAKARYLRIGRLQFWKETPVESIENSN